MPRVREDCRARPVEEPGVAIREALAAPAIGWRRETDFCLRGLLFHPKLMTFSPMKALDPFRLNISDTNGSIGFDGERFGTCTQKSALTSASGRVRRVGQRAKHSHRPLLEGYQIASPTCTAALYNANVAKKP